MKSGALIKRPFTDIPQTDFEQAFKDFHLTKGVICKYPQDYVKKGSSSRLEDILNSRQDDLSCSGMSFTCLEASSRVDK